MKIKPTLLCWLTCDGVHMDPSTGKHTLLGIFSGIGSPRFPLNYPYMVWFLCLTDCPVGEHKLKISMGENHTAMKTLLERPFHSSTPSQRISLVNEIKNLSFPRPSDYTIIIEIDNDPLLATSLVVNGP